MKRVLLIIFFVCVVKSLCGAIDIPADLQKKAHEGDKDALEQVAYIYYNNKEFDKAIEIYKKIAEMSYGYYNAMSMLSHIYQAEYKDYIQAKFWLQKLVNKHPNMSETMFDSLQSQWTTICSDEKKGSNTDLIDEMTYVSPEKLQRIVKALNSIGKHQIVDVKKTIIKSNSKYNSEKVTFLKMDESGLDKYYTKNKNRPKAFLPYVGFKRIPDDVQQRLIRDKFAIVDENFEVYKDNDDMIQAYKSLYDIVEPKGSTVSIFVTTDWLMHTFRTLNYKIQIDVERKILAPLLFSFVSGMYHDLQSYSKNKNYTAYERYFNTLYDVFTVAAVLSGEQVKEESMSTNARNELQKIKRESGVESSDIIDKEIAYMRFSPRIHYRETEQLQKYWRVFTWLSSLRFEMDIHKYPNDAALFVLFYEILSRNTDLMETYSVYIATMRNFFGDSNAYSYELLQNIDNRRDIIFDAKVRAAFIESLKSNYSSDGISRAEFFEIVPQTYNLDLYALEKLAVFEESHDERRIPHGYDTSAVFGNTFGRELIQKDFKTFSQLESNYTQLTSLSSRYSESEWQSNIHMNYLGIITTLYEFGSSPDFYFTQSKNWEKKSLMTGLSAWTQRMHDTVLYRRPLQLASSMGFHVYKNPVINYVEPNLPFFYRMRILLNRYNEMFPIVGVLDAKLQVGLERYSKVIDTLTIIAEKQALQQPISAEENEYINTLVNEMEKIIQVKSTLQETIDLIGTAQLGIRTDDPRMALVTDIAKWINPEAKIDTYQLNAIGKPLKLYVALNDPYGGKRIGAGYVYSYYEFMHNELLTDETWREQVYPQEGETVETKTDKLKKLKGKMPMWIQELVIESIE